MITLTSSRPAQNASVVSDSVPAKGLRPEGAAPIRTRGVPIALLGVPFDNVTTAEAVALIDRMVRSGRSHYLATANVDFLVQALHDVELRRILLL